MKLLPILVAGVLLGGCARSNMQNPPPQAPPSPARSVDPTPAVVEPVGLWDITADAQGETISGTMDLTRVDGRWGGRLSTSALPDIPVTGVTVQGQLVTVMGTLPGQGDVTIQMTVTGNEFAGTWSMGGTTGPIRGTRR